MRWIFLHKISFLLSHGLYFFCNFSMLYLPLFVIPSVKFTVLEFSCVGNELVVCVGINFVLGSEMCCAIFFVPSCDEYTTIAY